MTQMTKISRVKFSRFEAVNMFRENRENVSPRKCLAIRYTEVDSINNYNK